jgi:thymidylate kinase
MFIVLNGPLGIGKTTLAEALSESIDDCVMLGGDALVAVNPTPADEVEYLHSIIGMLVAHHRRCGYRHFVIEHIWRTAAELGALRDRLTTVDPRAGFRCFLLTLSADENLRRIARRRRARAIDDHEMELRMSAVERLALANAADLGEPFDVSAPVPELVANLRQRLVI